MTAHLCRDFLTLSTSSIPGTGMYVMSAFMHYVLGYGIVGHTNFDLSSYRLVSSLSASINQGLGQEYDVTLPTASWTVTSGDVERILALKSTTYPYHNSGLFRITAANTSSNSVTIDWRSSNFPPEEGDIPFAIFEAETLLHSGWSSGSNGQVDKYNTQGIASGSRIILRSPDELSNYQVRFALESLSDITGSAVVGMSIAPGFGGNDIGDYITSGTCLHGAQYYNVSVNSPDYRGLTVGSSFLTGSAWISGQQRISIVGDDETGTVTAVLRSASIGIADHWVSFGVPHDDDESEALRLTSDSERMLRLYVVGAAHNNPTISRYAEFQDRTFQSVVAWSDDNGPIMGSLSAYTNIMRETLLSDTDLSLAITETNQWLTGSEIVDVELICGTWDASQDYNDGIIHSYSSRRLGRLPWIRYGRANYGDWTIGVRSIQERPTGAFTTSSWLHTTDGVFIEWNGPDQYDTGAGDAIILVEPSTFSASSGMGLYDPNDPDEDPIEPTQEGKNYDAVRFKKTYSYFRQEPRIVGTEKHGSNPAKP